MTNDEKNTMTEQEWNRQEADKAAAGNIANALKLLNTNAEKLEAVLSDLLQQLAPILLHPAEDKKPVPEPDCPKSTLASQLDEVAGRIMKARDYVVAMKDRVDL